VPPLAVWIEAATAGGQAAESAAAAAAAAVALYSGQKRPQYGVPTSASIGVSNNYMTPAGNLTAAGAAAAADPAASSLGGGGSGDQQAILRNSTSSMMRRSLLWFDKMMTQMRSRRYSQQDRAVDL
jgi:hypothetical protein